MSEVCWSTFIAICSAFCVEAFMRALDGHGMHGATFGMVAGENPNTSPFNLVCSVGPYSVIRIVGANILFALRF